MDTKKLDFSNYVEIADSVFWVGLVDEGADLHCNPYLIVEDDEAVLIDSGSRSDFSTVMLKILRTGTNPKNIKRLIYHHFYPDLCGNIPYMEDMISSDDLKVLSHFENNVFINYYSPRSPMECIKDLGFVYEFKSGRRLEFISTPYAHSPGSFLTYDTKTKVLFSSDLFGSYNASWNLFANIFDRCAICNPTKMCSSTDKHCHVLNICDFQKRIMPSTKALHYALDCIEKLDVSMIAPQHGSIIRTPANIKTVIDRIRGFGNVGIDSLIGEEVE